jgi:hypothetical protein
MGVGLAPHIANGRGGSFGIDGGLIGPDIVKLWLRAFLRLAYLDIFAPDQLCDLAGGVFQIARNNGLFRADDYTGRLQTYFGTVRAIVAFGGGIGSRVNINRLVRASLHTRFAADTTILLEIYNPIVPFVKRLGGANRDAGRIFAMVATLHQKMAAGIWITSFFYRLNPGAKYTQRYFMFTFTGCSTCMATDTLALINNEAVSHLKPSFLCFLTARLIVNLLTQL